jgi:hypothetical protein
MFLKLLKGGAIIQQHENQYSEFNLTAKQNTYKNHEDLNKTVPLNSFSLQL